MRQPTLLEFHDVRVRNGFAKHTFHSQIMDQLLQLTFEDSRHQVRTIDSFFSRTQILLHLHPIRVGCDCDEEIRPAKFGNYGHGVEVALVKVSRATAKRGR